MPPLQLDLGPGAEELRGVLALGEERAELETVVLNRSDRHQRRLRAHPLRRRLGEVRGAVLSLSDDPLDLDRRDGEPDEA